MNGGIRDVIWLLMNGICHSDETFGKLEDGKLSSLIRVSSLDAFLYALAHGGSLRNRSGEALENKGFFFHHS